MRYDVSTVARRAASSGTGSHEATIRDVARLAEVSVGTVSRVLNRHPTVRPATRERVLAAIAHLEFEPSQVARSLSLKRTLSIARQFDGFREQLFQALPAECVWVHGAHLTSGIISRNQSSGTHR